jgi:hypothetical protein
MSKHTWLLASLDVAGKAASNEQANLVCSEVLMWLFRLFLMSKHAWFDHES